MRAREFIREATPTGTQPSGTSDNDPTKLATPATTAPKPITSAGTQPKPLTVTSAPQKPAATAPSAPSAPTLGSPTATNAPVDGQKMPPQNMQQQQQAKQKQQDQMTKDLTGIAQKMGMDPQQIQQFSRKLMGTGSLAGPDTIKQISPVDMQKAMPKPGANLNIKTLGQAKVLPTPGDEKGIKLDTTKKLGYPVLVDPRDLQR
jgi:hypothetical protein